MRRKLTGFLIVTFLINLNGIAFGGELPTAAISQQESQANTIEQLKQAVEKLEDADKDPNIPASVKELNRRYLLQRRSELETALNNEIAGLRRYIEVAGDGLKEDQKREVTGRILGLEQDLKNLKGASSGSTVAVIPPTREGNQTKDETAKNPVLEPKSRADAKPKKKEEASFDNQKPQQNVILRPASLTPTLNLNIKVKDCTEELAKPAAYSLYEKYICRIVRRIKTRKTGEYLDPFTNKKADPEPAATITGEDDFPIALALIAKLDPPDYLVAAEESRTDKQVGAGPQAGGTTSLVVKGSVPTILGMAVENGALTQSISGSTLTFRGNPVGIVQALANRGYLQSYEEIENSAFLRFLKPLSFSFSFDSSRGNEPTNTSPGNTTPAMNVFTGDRQQLSQVTARYEFINQRDPRHKKYREVWEKFLETEGTALNTNVDGFFRSVLNEPGLKEWRSQTQAILRETSADKVEEVVKARFAELSSSNLLPQTVEILKSIDQTFESYLTARKELLDKIAKGTIVALEYTNTRNVNTPNLSNFRFIAEKGPGGSFDATFNGSLTIFDKLPMGTTRRIRDFDFSGQVDYKTKSPLGSGDLIFFGAGKYQRLMEDAMDPMGMTIVNTKGDIAVGQVGIKIPLKGTGFKIPISFSFANRTELIKEKEIRGNIGDRKSTRLNSSHTMTSRMPSSA